MTFLQTMINRLTTDAMERVGPAYPTTSVVGAIWVEYHGENDYTVTAGKTEYGPYDYPDAQAAIVERITAALRKEGVQA